MAGVGPQVVQVLDFATARAPELQALHELAHHPQVRSAEADAKLVTQRNQRRRRANAFKSHAMPRRLRLPPAALESNAAGEEEHIALANRRSGASAAPAAAAAAVNKAADVARAKARAKRDQRPRCRKHRRRMHVLLNDHSWLTPSALGDSNEEDGGVAVVDTPKWLATHAWHAKRMLMHEKYGHVLAQRRHDKSVSAALTALRKNATLLDASYYGLLELYGLDTFILEALQLLVDPSGSEVDDTSLFSGSREGSAVLHHANEFPSGAIAPVRFMWRPVHGENEPGTSDDAAEDDEEADQRAPCKRQLWLWIHPAAFMEAATAIASACQEVMSEQDGAEAIEILDRRGHVARLQLRGKRASDMLDCVLHAMSDGSSHGEATDTDASDHEDGFSQSMIHTTNANGNLTSLRHELRRTANKKQHPSVDASLFTVVVQDPRRRSQSGDASHAPLPHAASLLSEPSVDASAPILCPLSSRNLAPGDAEEPNSELILAQLESLLQWTTAANTVPASNETPAFYPYAPPVHTTSPPAPTSGDTDIVMADLDATLPDVPCSMLWSLSGRDRMRRAFLKDHELNRRQQRDASAPVSLMLVRQPGAFPNSGGWDIVLSPVYAPTFLNALVFSGAMVIGQDEHEALATVAHEPSFPRDFPDTSAGRAYWDEVQDAREHEYVKKPKAKRVAYETLGVESPFQPNWRRLFDDQDASDEPSIPHAEDDSDDVAMDQPSALCVLRSASYMDPFPFARVMTGSLAAAGDTNEPMELIPVAVPTLIRVALSFPRRGALEPCSILYIPTQDDLANFQDDPTWSGRQFDGSELELLGFATSAVYDRPMGAFRGTAFCACEALQRLALAQRPTARGAKRAQLLALTRTPTSRQLRPVVIHIQA